MSIYCTSLWLSEGADDDEYTGPPPRAYQGSHVYPSAEHPPAHVDLGSIPHWCIPDHNQDGAGYQCTCGSEDPAPWLRLAIGDRAGTQTVALPREAVLALYQSLGEWLIATKEQS